MQVPDVSHHERHFPIGFIVDATALALNHAAEQSLAGRTGDPRALITYGELCSPFGLHPRRSGALCYDIADLFIERTGWH